MPKTLNYYSIGIKKYIFLFFLSICAFVSLFAQNAIVTENSLPGRPFSEWGVGSSADFRNVNLNGYATDISVNKGTTVHFKIDGQNGVPYTIKIYRLGYYGGLGASLKADLGSFPGIKQAAGIADPVTGLFDCGNWAESASWDVPANAVSGLYIAKLQSAGGINHIVFIVRDDASNSKIFFQTNDATWQAYNGYGGNSFYGGTTDFPSGHAVKVSYNRPFFIYNAGFLTNGFGSDWYMNDSYPMIRWLERNGYDMSYTTSVDAVRAANLILNHKIYLTQGHDEYWSKEQRDAVESARNAGIHMAFFSGNEVYWKTRWESDVNGTANRTLVCYKEGTLADGSTGEGACGFKCDPNPTVWTGLWRMGAAYDAPQPENALTGQISWDGVLGTIAVPDTYKTLRFWRNTSIASLATGATASLAPNTLGYEWDITDFPASYPHGRITMSDTRLDGQTHNLSLYRYGGTGGPLVFGAGTVQWSWGLDDQHFGTPNVVSKDMQQATVNLFADMEVQPGTLQSDLVAATASTDLTAPASVITTPATGTSIPINTTVTIRGTASDANTVCGVEISVDGGLTWHQANGKTNWSFDWTPTVSGTYIIKSRGYDDSGNMEVPGSTGPNVITIIVNPPGLAANAGPDQSITLPVSTVTLNGSGSTGTISSYLWTRVSGPNTPVITTPTTVSTTVTGLIQGTYVFQLSLNAGASTDQVTINVLAAGSANTIFTSQTPVGSTGNDGTAIELGVKFRSNTAGFITGVRFYKTAGNTGTHTGELYSSTGTRLAQATFTGETATGWQTVSFSSPVAITANTTYVAAYFSSAGNYTGTANFFTSALVNGPLTGLANGTDGPNGVYQYTGTPAFPTSFCGGCNGSNYWVDVVLSTNTTPTANAGTNQTITLPVSTVTLNGSGSTGTISSYLWTKVSGPNTPVITTPAAVSTTVTGLIQGTYVFQLSVNGGVSTSQVTITVNPAPPPTANAGTNQTITLPVSTVTLNGSGSTGTISSYLWTLVSGPNTPVITTPAAVSTTVTGLIQGTYVFQLSLNGGVSTSQVTVTVNPAPPPTANAGTNQTITLPVSTVTLNGSGSTGTISSYLWTLVSGPNTPVITTPAAVSTTVTGLIQGTYVFQLSLNGGVSTSQVTVTVNPAPPPTANAGTNQTITLPVSTVTLNGSGSTGTISSYLWTRVSGPNTPVITTPTTVSTTVTGLIQGTYVFQLSVNGGVSTSQVTINVLAAITATTIFTTQTPAGGTGNDGTAIELGVKFRSNTAGFITGVRFYKTVGNTGTHTGELYSSTGTRLAQATFTGETATGWQTVSFSSPVAITANTTYVAAYFSSAGNYTGTSNYFTSAVVNGPLTGLANGTDGPNGVYRYTGTPAFPTSFCGGCRGSNYWVDVVLSTNTTPTANAGTNQTITLPVSTVTLNGSGSTGTISSYLWTKVSGPNTPVITTPAAVSTTVTGLIQGTYVFQLSVNGGVSTSQVTITVNPAPPPTANAGTNQTITLPVSTVTLNGSGSTGTISSYLWTLVSGPNTPVITTPAAVSTTVTGLIQGTYVFQLSLNGGVSTSQVTVTVNPAPPPTANAGTNQTITLPVSTVTLNGSGSTGTISSYLWTLVSGPNTPVITTPAAVSTTVTGLIQGTYVFQLSLNGGVSTSQVTVTVNPAPPPTANAGTNQTITLPVSTVTLNGSGSTGTISSYLWTRVSGPNTPVITTPTTVSTTVTGLIQGTYVFQLSVNGGVSTSQVTINVLAAITATTIFTTQTPAGGTGNDGSSIELGVKFRSNTAGFITGVRFYKTAGNTGTHTGELYSSTGTRLAQATFTGETATGWQTVLFSSPVAITANTTYVAAYFSSAGNYTGTANYFTSAVVNGPLTGLANGTDGPNGVYQYTGTPAFPTSFCGGCNGSNYWVDVVFSTSNQSGQSELPNKNAINFDKATAEESTSEKLSYSLGQNYPNPSNLSTRINYSIPVNAKVELVLFDAQGRQIRILVNESKNAGTYYYDLNTTILAKGLYYYQMHSGPFIKVKKLVVQ